MTRERSPRSRWVRATLLGWFVGLIVTIVAAVLADSMGIRGSQAAIGVCMGLSVGLAQGLGGRRWFGSPRAWTVATAVGLGLPFVVGDLLALLGVELPYSLVAYVVLGGLFAGVLQGRVLGARSIENRGWVIASGIAWALAGAAVLLTDALFGQVPGLLGLFLFVAVILAGGLVNGLVTGSVLQRRVSGDDPATS